MSSSDAAGEGVDRDQGKQRQNEGDRTCIIITAHLTIFTEYPTIGWPELLGPGGKACSCHAVFPMDLLLLLPAPLYSKASWLRSRADLKRRP